MKKRSFDSLTDFFADIKNRTRCKFFDCTKDMTKWIGLNYSDVLNYKFSYPIGVTELSRFKEAIVEKPEKIRVYNQFDGYDIDVERMYENMDFIIDERKVKKLPKTIDIFVNICENSQISYQSMLNKTYAATKIIDHLESLGVRCSLYCVISFYLYITNGKRGYFESEPTVIEICVKNYHDNLNLGAVCTAISPWLFRYWGLNWIWGNYKNVDETVGRATQIPKESLTPNCIVIDNKECLNVYEANEFIEKIKIVA
jgi:hypothetical protein